MFVAATLPAESKMSVGAQLQRRFPALRWLNSERLHQGQRSLRHTWLEVDEQGWQTTLQARPHAAPFLDRRGLAATSGRFFRTAFLHLAMHVALNPLSAVCVAQQQQACWCY